VLADALVDDGPEDQGIDRADHGVDDDQDQEPDQLPPVGRGEAHDPPQRTRRELLVHHRAVAPERRGQVH
jgi:hypothetical protein